MNFPEKPKLSALVVVHNEEAQLADCLKCLAFADEIVVLLDKCTDQSKIIASKFTKQKSKAKKIFKKADIVQSNYINEIFGIDLIANKLDFSVWLDEFKLRAEKSGISRKTIDESLSRVEIIPRVIELDRKQPEFTLTLSQYLKNVASEVFLYE